MNTESRFPARTPSDESYSPGTARGTRRGIGRPLIAIATFGRTIAGLSLARVIIFGAAAVGICISLAGCTTTETVPVPTPVPVPGLTQYVPVPAELLTCEDTGPPPPKGAPLGDLFAWAQRTRSAAVECQGKLEQARALGR